MLLKTETQLEFEKEVIEAVIKYSDERVDIVIEDGEVFGTYHSLEDSYPVTESYDYGEIGDEFIARLEEKYNVGVFEN